MTLVDSNVLIDIWTGDPEWAEWSANAIERAASRGQVVVNPIIISELSRPFATEADLGRALARTGIRRVPLPLAVAWPVSQAFKAYRARGGTLVSPLADFYIGAHALAETWPLLTRDPARYRTYFPGVKLIAPKGR